MTIKLPRINVDRLSLTTGSWWSTRDVIEDIEKRPADVWRQISCPNQYVNLFDSVQNLVSGREFLLCTPKEGVSITA
jgi:hypothetical protein